MPLLPCPNLVLDLDLCMDWHQICHYTSNTQNSASIQRQDEHQGFAQTKINGP